MVQCRGVFFRVNEEKETRLETFFDRAQYQVRLQIFKKKCKEIALENMIFFRH